MDDLLFFMVVLLEKVFLEHTGAIVYKVFR